MPAWHAAAGEAAKGAADAGAQAITVATPTGPTCSPGKTAARERPGSPQP
ncbi:MAG TPA: hypothetical protein VGJ50_09415 [Streptosporangiaceae bacterium]